MKKSIIVNICGIVFHIDEDAYEILNNYLTTLKDYFISQSGGKEIVNDIEARIVELLQPKLSENKQSITIEDIDEIICILGKPEDIAGSEEAPSQNKDSASGNAPNEKTSRRLYRDPENAIIGGVSSGMAAYFNIDPVIFRLIFVALVFAGGAGFIIYFVLWISLPRAITTSQRLEMKGENINITNIEKKIREEYESVRSNISNISNNPSNKFSGFIHELVLIFGKLVLMAVSVLKYTFAVILIMIALSVIIGSVAGLFFSNFVINLGFISNIGTVQEFLNYFILPADTNILLLLGFMIVLIPCTGLIYCGLKILIRFQANDKWVSVAMSIIWILCIIAFTVVGISETNRFKAESTGSEITALTKPSKNILYIQLSNTTGKIAEFSNNDFNNDLFGVELVNNKKKIFAPIKIEFEKALGQNPEIEIIRKAYCSNFQEATETQKAIKVDYSQNDTVLSINPFFQFDGVQQWKFQHAKIIIRIPENVNIHFDKNSKLFINESNFYDYPENESWRSLWKITSNGLELKK